ncbi:mitochondrial large subunit ribosomal protein-domain-containing protein [Vararia minispora EC-137]|uniref:Mitochondrial large subunit ribosomal protein-domain-containing protein n=1 Tax=Vararia minispora EC-137 TaxID=1314806 RepID=A0ACB8QVA6_9AGAM|nr:mitochondrial large subunit ribosomal protein-domain-containing protein [Vararia minispora EC-137]
MLSATTVSARAAGAWRLYSHRAALSTVAIPASEAGQQTAAASNPALPYFVPRNSRGSLPVYSDIRNGGTRHLVLIRNVQGDIQALAREIRKRYSSPDHAAKVEVQHERHIVLSGGRWTRDVTEWLVQKGF